MTAYLLDTHALIWAQTAPEKLEPAVLLLMENRSNKLWVSVASLWEMAIKVNLGKLAPMPIDYRERMHTQGFEVLGITVEHVLEIQTLPQLHRDPFDRMLVAQAKSDRLTLITRDPKIIQYGVKAVAA